jgi:hypothetical protein
MGENANRQAVEGEDGLFQGRATKSGVCECGCGKPSVYFVDNNEVCAPQTAVARLRAVVPQDVLESTIAEAPETYRLIARGNNMSLEEVIASEAYARYEQRRMPRGLVVIIGSFPGDPDSPPSEDELN